jgi:hypothetical protein
MRISNTSGVPCKAAAPSNDNVYQLPNLSPIKAYVVRGIAKRAGVSTAVALAIAELAGITREARHG